MPEWNIAYVVRSTTYIAVTLCQILTRSVPKFGALVFTFILR